ncbi:hypothetical protein HYH03_009734 [Edaphochlamys debaryana]|uniref:Uncharacterized protein n=1 Tax=Edaphochlamys debaryana TaxID=47281 RepID=A0A835Y6P6_9CHLO|nr:hypothetical protein HYH03_009734 [Edaphochlamys debaryana]|eukprot:KAG2492004.1 hypothetical protein HYH03_009734 [Edaphochlamys debaryana]
MGKKLTIKDDHVLMTSGVVLTGLGALAAAKPLHKWTTEPVLIKGEGKKCADCWGAVGAEHVGIASMALGARDIVLAANEDALDKTKKNALKVAGFTHLAFAAWAGNCTRRGDFQIPAGATFGAVHAGVAGLCLWRGFRKGDEDKPATKNK